MAARKFAILTQNGVALWTQQDSIVAASPTEAACIYAQERFGIKTSVTRLSGLSKGSGLFRAESYHPGQEPEEGSWAPLAAPFFVL